MASNTPTPARSRIAELLLLVAERAQEAQRRKASEASTRPAQPPTPTS